MARIITLVVSVLLAHPVVAEEPACFDLQAPRSAVVLSTQDLLLTLPDRQVLLRTDGPCPGLLESADVWLRPNAAGEEFCGAGDALQVQGAYCAVIDMVAFDPTGLDCFRKDRTRAWSLLALDRLRVDTRSGNYEVTLSGSCPDLSLTDSVRFSSRRGLREICGGENDSVVPLGSGTLLSRNSIRLEGSLLACNIRSVQRISRR